MEFKIINPSVIRKSMMDNDEMITQFIELYLFQSPLDFEDLTIAMDNKNPKSIGTAAHHIKPTMEYIGASELRNDFQELEKLGYQEGKIDDIQEKYLDIKIKFELMLKELSLFLDTK